MVPGSFMLQYFSKQRFKDKFVYARLVIFDHCSCFYLADFLFIVVILLLFFLKKKIFCFLCVVSTTVGCMFVWKVLYE